MLGNYAHDNFLLRPVSVRDPASAEFRRSRPAGCAFRHRAGLFHVSDRPARLGAFLWLFHRLLVGATPDRQRRPFPRLRGLYRDGRHFNDRAFRRGRPDRLGADARRVGPVRGGMLYRCRGMVAGQGHKRDTRARHGRLPCGGHGRIACRTAGDQRSGTGSLCFLQHPRHPVLRRAIADHADQISPARHAGRPTLAPDAGRLALAAGRRWRGRRRTQFGQLSHGRTGLWHRGGLADQSDRLVPGRLRAGRRAGAISGGLAGRQI